MATKRLSVKAIDWAKLAERVPETEKPKFLAFKTKSDSYLRRMMASPEAPPKIDWAFYQKTVPVPGMVETFRKQYESMQIPFPADTVSSLIDAQEKEVKDNIEKFKQNSVKLIQQYRQEVQHLASLLPYEQMTVEDFMDAHPEMALDPVNKPTFWPHTPEEQLDYKEDSESSGNH